jgi:hypothetical protein
MSSAAARAALDFYDGDLSARRQEPGEDLPPPRDLLAMASAVDSKDSFLTFVDALRADLADELQKERIHPSSPYSAGANGWENGSIEAFLSAATAWGGATSAITGEPMTPDTPTCRWCALFLLAGKEYEQRVQSPSPTTRGRKVFGRSTSTSIGSHYGR